MWSVHHFHEDGDKLVSPPFAQWKTRKYPDSVSVKYFESLIERARHNPDSLLQSFIIVTISRKPFSYGVLESIQYLI